VNRIGYKMPQDGEEQEGVDRKITIFVLYRLTKIEKMWLSVYLESH
jgi:hypothetical protein